MLVSFADSLIFYFIFVNVFKGAIQKLYNSDDICPPPTFPLTPLFSNPYALAWQQQIFSLPSWCCYTIYEQPKGQSVEPYRRGIVLSRSRSIRIFFSFKEVFRFPDFVNIQLIFNGFVKGLKVNPFCHLKNERSTVGIRNPTIQNRIFLQIVFWIVRISIAKKQILKRYLCIMNFFQDNIQKGSEWRTCLLFKS